MARSRAGEILFLARRWSTARPVSAAFRVDAVEWVCIFSNLPNTHIGSEQTNCQAWSGESLVRVCASPFGPNHAGAKLDDDDDDDDDDEPEVVNLIDMLSTRDLQLLTDSGDLFHDKLTENLLARAPPPESDDPPAVSVSAFLIDAVER